MSDPVQLAVLIDSLSTKKDGSIKVVLETREFSPKDAAELFKLRSMEAWALIAPNEMTEKDLPTEKPDPAVGTKTQSQRLRAVIYRIWEQSKSGVDFESYYRTKMERVIEQFKEKLD